MTKLFTASKKKKKWKKFVKRSIFYVGISILLKTKSKKKF